MEKCFIQVVITPRFGPEEIIYFPEVVENEKATLKRLRKLGLQHPAVVGYLNRAGYADPKRVSFFIAEKRPSDSALRKSLAYVLRGVELTERKIKSTQKDLDDLWVRFNQQEEFLLQMSSDPDILSVQKKSAPDIEEVLL